MLGFSAAAMNAYHQNGSPSALEGEAEQTRYYLRFKPMVPP